ncbi:MAG: ABC transporter substrate-binding protein [bacterium]
MNRTFRLLALVSWLFCCSLLVGSCRSDTESKDQKDKPATGSLPVPDSSLQKVTLLPYWITTSQFAGYYIGKQKGIFRKHGIDLEILAFQPAMETPQLIREGKASFFLLWLVNAIELKASGLDIVNIAQLSTRSSLLLVTKKSSGIRTIKDMNGKRAGIWLGYELQPRVLFQQEGIDVKIIPIGSSNNLFLAAGVEIINASWFDEYHTILNSGYDPDELETFFFADYGLNFLEDGIYCMKSALERDPGLCRRFVEASLESWIYAFAHPEEAIALILEEQKKQRIPANLAHQRWTLARYHDLFLPEGEPNLNTTLKESDYQNIAGILQKAGLIGTIPAFQDFYKPAY